MKTFLLCVSVAGVSIGGSLAANYFPYSLFLTVPASFLVGYAAYMRTNE